MNKLTALLCISMAGALSGCMANPRDGQFFTQGYARPCLNGDCPNENLTIQYQGVVQASMVNRQIHWHFTDWRTGQDVDQGPLLTVTSTNPITDSTGTTYFEFSSGNQMVPSIQYWKKVGTDSYQAQTWLTDDLGNLVSFKNDSATNACINRQNGSIASAALNCGSPNSPKANLFTCHYGPCSQ